MPEGEQYEEVLIRCACRMFDHMIDPFIQTHLPLYFALIETPRVRRA